jgi:hypothetical protein
VSANCAPGLRVAALASLALALTSCADGSDSDVQPKAEDRRAVAGAIGAIQRAFDSRDMPAICARMTEEAKVGLGAFGHGATETCPKDLRDAFRVMGRNGGLRHAGEPRLARVAVDGDRATATVALGERRADVALVRRGERWKLGAFAGIPVKDALRLIETMPTRPYPAEAGVAVEAFDGQGRPCPVELDPEEPTDDCVIDVSGDRVVATVLTQFGDFTFGTCKVFYWIHVDATGRTLTFFDGDPRGSSRALADAGCSDLDICYSGASSNSARWKGRLRADGDGGFVNRVDGCFATWAGFFVSPLELRLTPTGDGMRVRLAGTRIGTTGLELTGSLRASAPALELRAVGR